MGGPSAAEGKDALAERFVGLSARDADDIRLRAPAPVTRRAISVAIVRPQL
jgi:hypothetical protein